MKCKKNKIQDESGEKIYLHPEDNSYIVEYRDEIFLEGDKQVKHRELGVKFSQINSYFLDYLNAYNIPTGFRKSSENTIIYQMHSRYPFTIRISNIVNKRISKVFGKKEGEYLALPVLEFLFGNSKDNLITESHLISMDVCSVEEIKTMKRICSKINAVLKSYFERRSTYLAEVICVFGKDEDRIYAVDCFTPKSLKVIPFTTDKNTLNPYKIRNAEDFINYVEFISGLTKN